MLPWHRVSFGIFLTCEDNVGCWKKSPHFMLIDYFYRKTPHYSAQVKWKKENWKSADENAPLSVITKKQYCHHSSWPILQMQLNGLIIPYKLQKIGFWKKSFLIAKFLSLSFSLSNPYTAAESHRFQFWEAEFQTDVSLPVFVDRLGLGQGLGWGTRIGHKRDSWTSRLKLLLSS